LKINAYWYRILLGIQEETYYRMDNIKMDLREEGWAGLVKYVRVP
jgi:hypothetical protein